MSEEEKAVLKDEKISPLAPGMIIFVDITSEGAAPGWYQVRCFDHQHSRFFGGWWWRCERCADNLMQSVEEGDVAVHADVEGAPEPGTF